ncbi:hypothetical protein Taro_017705 [Colocasia esculenta]|uniref:Uncharacterized protein n=1 Tax=Colocasia esculenta TaxID=4460 RepID=A0A843URU1_COLES|nr:hypothetical protein [Colocasia esculenta]
MAAGLGVATVVLAVGWLFHLIAVNNDPSLFVGDGRNPSEIAVYSAFTAFLVYIAGIVILFFDIFTQAGGRSAREAKLVPVQHAWWSNTAAAAAQQGVCEEVATLCRRIRQQRRTSRAQRYHVRSSEKGQIGEL